MRQNMSQSHIHEEKQLPQNNGYDWLEKYFKCLKEFKDFLIRIMII